MIKLKKFSIFIFAVSIVFMYVCFNSVSSTNSDSKELALLGETQNDESIKVIYDEDSTQQLYLEKLDKLDTTLKISLEEKYNSPVTLDLMDAATEEYKQWDTMLNKIYSKLKEELPQEDVTKLNDEQLKWIHDRDIKSKDAYNSNKDGSIAPLNSLMSLIDTTQKRCYELVNQYMK